MTKSLLIAAGAMLALSLVSAPSQAESGIILYGVLDGGIAVTKDKGDSARVHLDSGVFATNRFGFKGTEDLGGGNSVGFILEQGFSLFDGDVVVLPKGAFSLQSTLSLKGNWGEVAAGWMGGLSSDGGTYSILHGSSIWTSYYASGSIYGAFDLSVRMKDTIVYKTPTVNNWTGSIMYSNAVNDEDDQKWSKNDHYYGAGLNYVADKTLFSVIAEVLTNETKGADATQIYTLGGSHNFGSFSLYGGAQYVLHAQKIPGYGFSDRDKDLKLDFTFGRSGVTHRAVTFAVGFPVSKGELKFQGNFANGILKDTFKQGSRYKYLSLAIAYEYPVSKKLYTYAYGGYGTGWGLLKNLSYYNSWTTCLGVTYLW